MASSELVPFTTDRADSAVQTVGSGDFHTIIPLFNGSPGKVTVSLLTSDDGRWLIKTISSRDTRQWDHQIRGPAEYIVSVRNAGADIDTGA